MEYLEFLKSKIDIAKDSGFEVKREDINPILKPHQKDAVMWAIRGGRRALFESFGLGKTVQEIEFCHQIVKHKGGKALIVLPLGVKQEFTHGAVEVLGYKKPEYVRNMEEVKNAESDRSFNEKYKAFNAKFNYLDDGKAAQRVTETIIEE